MVNVGRACDFRHDIGRGNRSASIAETGGKILENFPVPTCFLIFTENWNLQDKNSRNACRTKLTYCQELGTSHKIITFKLILL